MSTTTPQDKLPNSEIAEKIHLGSEMLLKLFEKQENSAVIKTDTDGFIRSWNAGAGNIFKYVPEEAVGKHISLLYPKKEKEEKDPAREFEKAKMQGESESTLLLLRKDGSSFYAKCFLFPVQDGEKDITGYVKVIQTLHDPQKSVDIEGFLNEIDHVLTSSLDYRTILKQVIKLCVPTVADWVYVDQLQKNGTSKRTDVVHADPSKARLAKETQKFTATAGALNYPQAKAQYQRKSILIPKITEEVIVKSAQNKEHERVMREINPNSLIATPLIARGRTLGTLTFMVGESGRTFSRKDLKLAEEIARRTALVLDNALLYEQAQWERNRLQSLFIEAPVAIAIVSVPDYLVELANPPICELWGRSQNELLGNPIFDVIPEAEEQGFRALVDQVVQTKKPFIGNEIPIELQRGESKELLYLNFVYQPLSDKEGNVHSIMAIAIDVSEQVQARHRVEESKEQLRIALEAGKMGTWHLNLENDTSSRSLEHDMIFGYSSLQTKWGIEEFTAHLLAEDREMVSQKFEQATATGSLSFESRIKRADGELRWIAVQGQVFYNSNGEAERMAGVITDITELVQARQKAQENAERFRLLLETIPQITWTHTKDGAVSFYNQRWYDYTGLTKEQSLDYGWREIIHPEDLSLSVETISKATQAGEAFEMENRFRRASDGMYRWHLVRALPVRNEKGEITIWVGTSTDIHDQKMQSNLLKKQNQKLDEINKYLDNFVHTVAHDLRSPVANIIGLLQLLTFKEEDSRNINISDKLKTSVERLDNTLKGMIKLIEIQSISGSSTQLLSLKEVFEDVVSEFTSTLQDIEHSVTIRFEGCPPIIFIKPYLESIFRNLISNAIKYRNENLPLQMDVSCRKEGEFVLIQFKDNGIGIDLQKHEKNLFKPFVRFTQQASGKGIGLHIINNMLQRNGGKVEVESTLGEGTTFKLYLKE